MVPAEYVQLKAFARIDGLYIGIAWIISFACYIGGLTSPLLGMIGTIIAVVSPFYAAMRLRNFRDTNRNGIISFRRAMAYYIFIFFYASLIFALAQYVYFAYIDGGYMINTYNEILSTPEAAAMIKAYGVSTQQMNESLAALRQAKPIYIVLNILTFNLTIGVIMSLPVAAMMKRTTALPQSRTKH